MTSTTATTATGYQRVLDAVPELRPVVRVVDALCALVRDTDTLCHGCVWESIVKPLVSPWVGWDRGDMPEQASDDPPGTIEVIGGTPDLPAPFKVTSWTDFFAGEAATTRSPTNCCGRAAPESVPVAGVGGLQSALAGYQARLCHRHRGYRTWKVPARTGGTFSVEVTLRPRWCSVSVDRWHTTDRPTESEAWFREHIWPAVEAALQVRRVGCGSLPSGGGAFACADPLARGELLDVLARWVEAESMW